MSGLDERPKKQLIWGWTACGDCGKRMLFAWIVDGKWLRPMAMITTENGIVTHHDKPWDCPLCGRNWDDGKILNDCNQTGLWYE